MHELGVPIPLHGMSVGGLICAVLVSAAGPFWPLAPLFAILAGALAWNRWRQL